MHITAICPHCETSYKVQPSLRGQALRCNHCRKVYIVGKEVGDKGKSTRMADGPNRPSSNGQSGNVTDLLDVLPAELDAPLPEPIDDHVRGQLDILPVETADPLPPLEPIDENGAPTVESWHNAPPPVRSRDGGRVEAPPTSVKHPKAPAGKTKADPPLTRRDPDTHIKSPPSETKTAPPASWEPPPVRRGGPANDEPTLPTNVGRPVEPETPAVPIEEAPPRKRRSTALLAVMTAAVLALGIGVPVWYFSIFLPEQERRLFVQAKEKLQQGNAPLARTDFEALVRQFPKSEHVGEYQSLLRLAERRLDLMQIDDYAAAEPLNKVERFLEEDIKARQHEALLQEHASLIKDGVLHYAYLLGQEFANPKDDTPTKLLVRIDEVVAALDRVLGPEHGFKQADRAAFDKVKQTLQDGLNVLAQRQKVVGELAILIDNMPNGDGVRAAEELLNRAARQIPGIRSEPDIVAKLNQLYDAHQANVKWIDGDEIIQRSIPDDDFASIILDPLVQGPPGRAGNGRVVLALVRGVLYGLDRISGRVKWAMRVGIDTSNLPLRVPATESSPERILVVSTDTQTVTALDADGNSLWRHRLDSRSLGRPVVVGKRAYLTTYNGDVHVIELVEGRLLGRFRLGQPLSLGATYDDASKRLYVAADNSCVYVLDIEGKKCDAILYTDHASGSQRSEPLVVPAQSQGQVPSFLVLNQSEAGDNALKMYELPLTERRPRPVVLQPDPRISGWSWFRPHQDSEKIVILSDAGVLGAFGIKQPHNNLDGLLFPLLPAPSKFAGGAMSVGLPLDELLEANARTRGRAEVVHVQGNDLWVLAHGKLQRLGVGWFGPAGPKLVTAWPKPLELGSPQHSSQSEEDRQGRATLYLVTQALARPVYLASAVDDEEGKLLWQRQLGMVCQGEPLVLDLGGDKSVVLAMDEGGGLFAFDTAPVGGDDAPWQSRGKLLAKGLDENAEMPPLLLPGSDRASAIQIATPGEGRELVVRFIAPAGEGANLKFTELRVPLPAPLAGIPALVGGNRLILPLTNGVLAWLAIPNGTAAVEGPNWRSRIVGAEARGYVVALDGNRLLTTDGARGLTVWDWPQPAAWVAFPPNQDPPTLELPDRISGAPLALPPNPAGLRSIVVPTVDGTLTLLTVQANGTLKIARTWKMPGKVTAGPFLIPMAAGPRVGCVVANNQLVCIDPAKDAPASEYRTSGKGIVGVPRLANGLLMVADHSGRYVAVDPATGNATGPGHVLRGSLGPAAAPVAFGVNRLFAPLTDGTVLLLPLERLKPAAK